MAQSLKVKVLSPARILFDADAQSVLLPGTLGYMEILPSHARMVAELDVGKMVIKKADGAAVELFIAGGYVDISNDDVKVLVDVAEFAKDIDKVRARSALQRADDRLVNVQQLGVDLARAQYAKKRAAARLDLAGGS